MESLLLIINTILIGAIGYIAVVAFARRGSAEGVAILFGSACVWGILYHLTDVQGMRDQISSLESFLHSLGVEQPWVIAPKVAVMLISMVAVISAWLIQRLMGPTPKAESKSGGSE